MKRFLFCLNVYCLSAMNAHSRFDKAPLSRSCYQTLIPHDRGRTCRHNHVNSFPPLSRFDPQRTLGFCDRANKNESIYKVTELMDGNPGQRNITKMPFSGPSPPGVLSVFVLLLVFLPRKKDDLLIPGGG